MTTPHRPHPKRRSAQQIRRQLRAIYESADGRVPDLSRLEQGGKSGLTRFLLKTILLLGALCVLAWAGFFLFSGGLFTGSETLKLTVEGPDEVKSGEEISYTLMYENVGDVPIAALTAKLNVPVTFHVYSTVPDPPARERGEEPRGSLEWTIGSLNAGSDGAITITGVFLADVPSSERLQALFTYKPANFSSDFQDIVTHKVDIMDSVVALSFTGPEKALAGDRSEYVINVQNTGSQTVYNLRVTPSLAPDFTVLASMPALEDGQAVWTIPALLPGELAAITMEGAFTSTAAGEQTLGMNVGFVNQDLVYVQRNEELVTDVLGGTLAFSVIVNGSAQSQAADLGETLRLSIDYANNSKETAQDMSFTMEIVGENGDVPIDWKNANLGGGTRTGNEVNWEGLDALAPETSNVIDVSLPVFDRLDPGEADAFTIAVTLTLNRVGTITSTRTLEATPIVITLNSDAQANAQARYYSQAGAAVGSGLMPPQVGETTSYRVYWNLANTLHTLENVRLSATIPQDVTWLESTDTDIGTVSYNSTTRQITWTIPKLLAQLGHAGAWFEVAISPDSGDVGRFIKLTSTTSFEARDATTNQLLSRSLPELTTELPEDEFAAGKGVVVE